MQRRGLKAALLVGVVAVVLVATHALWLPAIGRFLVVSDPLQEADAILPLGGAGRTRTAAAAELYAQGLATWFVVTDTPLNMPGVREDYATLMRQEAVWQGVPEERVLRAPGTVTTTYNEALAVRQLVAEQGWHALIIVTDAYHTRRARMAFADAFRGSGVRVIVHAVNPGWYDANHWWQDTDSLRETWTEYLKLLLYVLGYK